MKLDTNIRPDWTNVKLGEICEKAVKIKRKEVIPDEKFIYLDIGGIDNQSNRIVDYKKYNWENAPSRAQQIVKVGDTLFSTVRTYLKNIAMVNNSKYENQICSSGFTVIRAINGLADSKFLFAISLSEGFLQPLNKLQTGTSYPAVRDHDVFGQIIPLPPLPEQRAIVSKIEQLFSDLDNGIENFKKAQEHLKIYRQAVLKKAFEGELTKKWREEQADLPSAEELLQQIKEEREKYYQKQLDGWEQDVKEWKYEGNKGKKPTKPKKTKELFPLTEKELAVLLELPDGKFWLKLGMLTLNVEYGTSAKSKKEGKIPVLRMGNIQNNCFVWNDLVYTDDEDEINKYLLKKGDVQKTAIFAGYLIRINQIHSLVNPNYLNYFLNSYTAKVHGNTVKTDGVNQSNINGEKLKNYPFPYFSLLEQHQIVSEIETRLSIIETRLSICDKMESTIAESLQKAESLRQSILKKAFEGKLLNEKELEKARNAPDWEPSEKLVERIRQEKQIKENNNKPTRRKTHG